MFVGKHQPQNFLNTNFIKNETFFYENFPDYGIFRSKVVHMVKEKDTGLPKATVKQMCGNMNIFGLTLMQAI